MKFWWGFARLCAKFIKGLMTAGFILFLSVVATFFLTIFLPNNVLRAFEIFKNLF